MRSFFSQFGEVLKVKLFKSPRTGKSKGYAFVEFESKDIAEVVADVMNGYLMFDKQLVCNVVPCDKVHEGMFLHPKNQNAEPTNDVDDVPSSPEKIDADRQARTFLRSQRTKIKKLKQMGIDFKLPAPKELLVE